MHVRQGGSSTSGNSHFHQLNIHAGMGNQRQQQASAVQLESPRQVETESEEGGVWTQDGCSHPQRLPVPSLTSLEQVPPKQSNAACLEHTGHKQEPSKGFPRPQKKRMEFLHVTWDFPPSDTHQEGLLPGWTRAQGAGCTGGVHSHHPHVTTMVLSPCPHGHCCSAGKDGGGAVGTRGSWRPVRPPQLRPKQASGIKCKL